MGQSLTKFQRQNFQLSSLMVDMESIAFPTMMYDNMQGELPTREAHEP